MRFDIEKIIGTTENVENKSDEFTLNNNLNNELNKRQENIKKEGYFKTIFIIVQDFIKEKRIHSYEKSIELAFLQFGKLGVFALLYNHFNNTVKEKGLQGYCDSKYSGTQYGKHKFHIHFILLELFKKISIEDDALFYDMQGLLEEFSEIVIDNERYFKIPEGFSINGDIIYRKEPNKYYKRFNKYQVSTLNDIHEYLEVKMLDAIEIFYKNVVKQGVVNV